MARSLADHPPEDWDDKQGWNLYFVKKLTARGWPSTPDFIILRFLPFAQEQGGRIWFPGCGIDGYPKAYAARGCNVLATDFSRVALTYQASCAEAFAKQSESAKAGGSFAVAEQDFTLITPNGEFDVVINCRAFQGLSPDAMNAAARHVYAALRPGGTCILDTINVQGQKRNLIEDSLIAAGFYIGFQKSERWYREQLDTTGIVYGMVLGRPHIPNQQQYPPEHFREWSRRDQQILDSFRAEYERRREAEMDEVKAARDNPATSFAHVVYATG